MGTVAASTKPVPVSGKVTVKFWATAGATPGTAPAVTSDAITCLEASDAACGTASGTAATFGSVAAVAIDPAWTASTESTIGHTFPVTAAIPAGALKFTSASWTFPADSTVKAAVQTTGSDGTVIEDFGTPIACT